MTGSGACPGGAEPPGRVRCATFNVLHGREIRGDGRPPSTHGSAGADRALFADAVASLNADVLALQEVDRLQERSGRVDQAAAAAKAAGAEDWRYAAALHGRWTPDRGWILEPSAPGLRVYGPGVPLPRGDVPSHGVALLSRLPVHRWRARRIAPAPLALPLRVPGRPRPAMVRDQPRVALAAVLEGPRGPFTAVAVHLSFVPGWNVGQLLAVRAWIDDLPRPHVLLGDFNLTGPVPGAVLNAADLVGHWLPGARHGRPAARAAPGRWRSLGRTPTYPSHRPVVQFDHVLAAGIGAGAVAAVNAPGTAVSDHRPLVVELSL
ncbi:endonuclease/exonuclease/phosphatase family protein [Streptomyces sp. NPDC002004]